MNKILAFVLIFLTAQGAIAGPVVNTIPNDTLRFGKPSSGLDKTLEFNLGLGSTNPKVKWSVTDSALEFANDGTSFVGVGSGSGGAGGINLLAAKNGDFESGTVNWTASGGTFVIDTANPINGKKTGSWTPSANAQTFSSAVVTVNDGTAGNSCAVSLNYKTAEATNFYTLQVVDGSANVLASVTVPSPVSTVNPLFLPFQCPAAAGTVQAKLVSSGAASAIRVDDVAMGKLNLSQVSQATFFGSIDWDAVTNADNTSVADFSSTGYTASNQKGALSTPGSAVIGFTANMPAGEYSIQVGTLGCRDAAGNNAYACQIGISDDGATFLDYFNVGATQPSGSTYQQSFPGAAFHVSYATSGIHTIRMRGGGVGSGDHADIGENAAGTSHFRIKVYRFPTASEQAFRADTINWKVSATQSGANVSLGTVAGTVGTTVLPSAASLNLSLDPGSASAYVPCSGGNAPTGTTCSAGTTEAGVAFNLPAAGDVQVCAQMPVLVGMASTGTLQESFDLAETASTNETIIQQANLSLSISEQPGATVNSFSRMLAGCSTMHFASSGLKTLRAVYQYVIGTANLTQHLLAADTTGGRKIHWTVTPITQNVPAPVLVGSVITPSTGVKKIVAGYFAGGSSVAACSSSPCSLYGGGNESVSSVTRTSAGVYIINFSAGTFSAQPVCTCSPEAHVVNGCQFDMAGTTSSAAQINTFSSAGALTDGNATFICVGSK